MTPKTFKQHNIVYAKDQPEYVPLPAHVSDEGIATFCWRLSWRERMRILFTGEIWHQVMTFRQPLQPHKLTCETPFKQSEVRNG